MSAEPITDDEPDEPGGDCSPYVQLCRCFRAHADDLGLKAPDRHALLELVLAADYRTAVISSITWDDIASMLGYSRPTAQERLGALASAGAIRYRFPRGHPGFVAVLCYLDVVRVASASRADHIAEALRKEVAKADRADERAAAKIAAATKASNGATNPTAGTSNAESLPSGARIFRSDDTTPLPKGSPEPPGESMGAEGQISPRPLFASTGAVGKQSLRTTSGDRSEATRSARVRAYDTRLFGEQP